MGLILSCFFQAESSTSGTTPPPVSATERKFSYREVEADDAVAAPDVIAAAIVRTTVLSALVENLACTLCGSRTLIIRATDENLGMICKLQTFCTTCEEVINSTLSSDRIGGSRSSRVPFVVTRSAVSAAMDAGVGYAGLDKFCRFLDMPVLHPKTFNTHVKAVAAARVAVTDTVMAGAARTVREVHALLRPAGDDNAILDLTVSFDGTWMRRGHKSLYGVGFVVEVVTGLVIDYHVMSLYCQSCAIAAAHYGDNDEEFDRWREQHTTCSCNYAGSSGAMEKAAAEVMWRRSEDTHRFRYTTMLSDGDSSTHKHLCDLELYDGTPINKEECINHVAKRLGTALRKVVAEEKKGGTTLGGRGYGKLTQVTITKLTAYYGKAIRGHPGDLDGMCDAVFATLLHAASTDDDHDHTRCPSGPDSWCFYQRALAADEEPGPHRQHVGTPLCPEVAACVRPIYTRLGHKDLLRRCLGGVTQNANESLHSKVWAKCPKVGFAGLVRVKAAACSAIAEFNEGVESAVARTYTAMGLASGRHLRASSAKADERRVVQAKRRSQEKAARRPRKVVRPQARDDSYEAGGF